MEKKIKFHYSQASLQDFSACNRRFYYRYHERLKWPSVESAPVLENENFMAKGAAFHLLAHQYILGIDLISLSEAAKELKLMDWWDNFQSHLPFSMTDKLIAEKKFVTRINDNQVLAKFDLVIKTDQNKLIIFDWKTSSKLPSRTQMENRWQSKVYPYVLTKMAKYFDIEDEINPDDVELQYWYPQFPKRPEIFTYSKEKYIQHEDEIGNLIDSIELLNNKEDFLLTDNKKLCGYCVYRSLCDRGTIAGNESERIESFSQEQDDWDIDFEQVGEIAF